MSDHALLRPAVCTSLFWMALERRPYDGGRRVDAGSVYARFVRRSARSPMSVRIARSSAAGVQLEVS